MAAYQNIAYPRKTASDDSPVTLYQIPRTGEE